MKKIISMVLALSLLCTVGAAFAEGPGGRGGNGGGTDKSGDTELQTMIAEVAPKFHPVVAAMETWGNEYIAHMQGETNV